MYEVVAAAEAVAEGVAGAEGAAAGLQELALGGSSGAAPPPAGASLLDALDTWTSFAGGDGGRCGGARLVSGPFSLLPVEPRPIMLDSAAGCIDYPDLGHRAPGARRTAATAAAAAGGMLGRMFGGWGT